MTPKADHGEKSYRGLSRLEGRVALIIGGDSGIGRAVAIAFAREGADVLISYLDEDEDAGETVAQVERAGRKAIAVGGDIGNEAHCRSLVERTVSELGRLDVLVNNAASQTTHESIDQHPSDEIERIFRTNILAMFWLCKAAVPHMKPGSAIINTSSIQAYQPDPILLPYSTTKGAIVAFTKGLAQELTPKGIRVNSVAPGPVWTPLIPMSMPHERVEQVRHLDADGTRGTARRADAAVRVSRLRRVALRLRGDPRRDRRRGHRLSAGRPATRAAREWSPRAVPAEPGTSGTGQPRSTTGKPSPMGWDMAEFLATLGPDALRDPGRLRALRRSRLLDTPTEPALDRWTSLVARTMPAPVALLTLLDDEREFVKSAIGLPPDVGESGELPLSQSLCALILETDRPLVVQDADDDARVQAHAAVLELGVRAYVGFPVRSFDGHVLGAICAIDTVPRRWTDSNLDVLEAIAAGIELELELSAGRRERERLQQIVASHHAVHDLIVAGAPLAETLELLIRGVESQADGMRGSVFLRHPDGRHLEHAASPSLPADYARAIDGLAIGPESGGCGTAVHSNSEVIAADVATDPHWVTHRGLAARYDIGACWSVPIADAEGYVVGTFAFYDDKPRRPTSGELTLIRHASRLAGIAIERHRNQASLIALVDRDSLTGLANRALLLRAMRTLLASSAGGRRPLAVLFCDLNRFKLINDSLGHAAGDRVLGIVARRLASCAGPDDVVARLGGDEFVIVATDLDADQARELAGRAARVLSRPIHDEETRTEHHVTASIGVALGDGEGDADDLIRHADTAMFAAKRSGAGIAFYQSDSRASAIKELQLHTALRAALETDQFHVVYQPVVEFATGRVASVEALLRWTHPVNGPVSPADFIPVAEQHGLIADLGDWVLRRAVAEALDWNELTDRAVPVAVNVSARQLIDPHFADRVRDILASMRMAPQLLTLEITETALVGDDTATLANLRVLGALGVAIALDDFGTGYSSLSHLRRLPIDTVKVDRSFIDGLGADHDDTAIVTGVIAMARGLSLATVAEGVETEAQAEALRRLGCEYAQGYLYARPLSAADVLGVMLARRG